MPRLTKVHGYYDLEDKTSSTGIFLHIPIGAGLFRANLSMNSSGTNPSLYWMSFRYKSATGGTDDFLIDSGYIDLENHAHVQNVEFEGPGSFTAYMLPVASYKLTFQAYIRRIQP